MAQQVSAELADQFGPKGYKLKLGVDFVAICDHKQTDRLKFKREMEEEEEEENWDKQVHLYVIKEK